MIAKITYGAGVAGCAEYDIDKAKDARVILANELPLTTDIEQIQTLFNIQASLSSRVEKPVMHIVLSFSPDDASRLASSPQMAKNIIEGYMHRMGLDGTQYIATEHRNTRHPHFHILANRVFPDGHVYKTGFERSRSVKACRELTEIYGLTMGKGRSNVNEASLKEPDRSKQILYREISHALRHSTSSRDFWDRLKNAGVKTYLKLKDGKVVGYSFKMDDTCRISGGKISRDFTRGNLMKALREKDLSLHERPTLVIPKFDQREEEDLRFTLTANDHSMEQDIRKKRRKRGMGM